MASSSPTYQKGVIRLHWISAVVILILLGMGFWMVDLELSSDARLNATRAHTVGGILCLSLTLARLIALLRSTPPPPPVMSPLHLFGVQLIHVLQYIVLFAMLGSGLALLTVSDLPRALLGTAPLPDVSTLLPKQVHEVLGAVFALLLGAHVGGVVIMQLQGGRTLQRMGFGDSN